MGCKGKYADWITEDGLATVRGWARDGCSDIQIAANVGISIRTYYEWCERFPQFLQTIKKGRAPVAVAVEDAFYSKCEWQDYEETREEIIEHPNGEKTKKVVRVRHKVPPDTAALIFALKNLRPDKYRDKPMQVDGDSMEKHNALVNAIRAVMDE